MTRFHLINKGFTLIELLVVIAVVGVLAGAVIAVINPSEQLARSRDAARKSAIEQLGKAFVGYSAINGSYPVGGLTWLDTLRIAGQLRAVPTEITPRPFNIACWSSTWIQNNFCYYTQVYNGQPEAWAWTNVESKALLDECGVTTSTLNNGPYYVHDTITRKTCLKCASDIGGNSWVFAGACHPGE